MIVTVGELIDELLLYNRNNKIFVDCDYWGCSVEIDRVYSNTLEEEVVINLNMT